MLTYNQIELFQFFQKVWIIRLLQEFLWIVHLSQFEQNFELCISPNLSKSHPIWAKLKFSHPPNHLWQNSAQVVILKFSKSDDAAALFPICFAEKYEDITFYLQVYKSAAMKVRQTVLNVGRGGIIISTRFRRKHLSLQKSTLRSKSNEPKMCQVSNHWITYLWVGF